jgi:retron-type reverse transcriptase
MIKDGISAFAPSLATLFNLILKNGSFPSLWRLSSLTVIHKKGDKSIPKNYRGIAVSSNLCKLFCLVLYNRLNVFTDNNNVIPPNQIGFRKGARTSDHILVLKSLIDKYINRAGKSYLYVCFIDFSAAFDTVWRNALLYKLIHIGIGGNFLRVIRDMYSSVSFAIKYDNKLTDSFETTVGVKQGCVLSPIFFNIYLSDLPSIFDSNCDPVTLNNTSLSCLMYADDLIILSESAKGLKCALDKLYQYCMKWKLVVNIDKSNIMIFNKSGRVLDKFQFKLWYCRAKNHK